MIKPSILNTYTELVQKSNDLKLKLEQKEVIKYTSWKSLEANSKDRTAMDKVIANLKLEDEVWLNEEQQLQEYTNLKQKFKLALDILQTTLNKSDVSVNMFNDYQDNIIETLDLDIEV